MAVRKIAATYIFPVNRPPVKNGILTCTPDGTIVEISGSNKRITEQSGLEFYSGILVPGFVNTHCHLELSNLKGKIEEKTGIGGFIGKINQLRNEEVENTEKAIQIADRKMWASGISAVGDVSNTTLTIETKKASKIYYHTFIESFGFHPSRAVRAFDYAEFVQFQFKAEGLVTSIVPHSSYSVSKPLFEKIQKNAVIDKSIVTIHNQESESESEFFKNGTGAIANHLTNNLGIDISHWKPTEKSSLAAILDFLPTENQLLLVHNTFTTKEDLDELKKKRSIENTFFVLCPNSNLYIENQLPPVLLFQDEKLNICLGTDSLASNHNLSILSEMITIQLNFPDIKLDELLMWACLNGAKALQIENNFGSLEVGKKPGINLISGIDFKKMCLTESSRIKRLV
jgi:cytosine/adenosine deaminase-related metal-dependent hydrolase